MNTQVPTIEFEGYDKPIPISEILTIVENVCQKDSNGNVADILIIVLTNGATIFVPDTPANRSSLGAWKKLRSKHRP